MRRASFFGPVLATIGVVAEAAGIVAEALRPMIGPAYLIYGLLLPTWFALAGWRLLHLDPEGTSRAR